MPADLLAGLSPRPTTPVPGLWLLDAPSTIHVRVFTAPPLPPLPSQALQDAEPVDAAPPPNPTPPPAANTSPLSTASRPSTSPLALPTASRPRSQPTLQITPIVPSATDALQADRQSSHAPLALERLRADPIERAWLAFNTAHSDGTAPTRGLFTQPCVVVRPASATSASETPSAGASSGDTAQTRQLWVFSADAEISGLESLTEVLPAPAPIVIAETVTCAEHGHTLSCLACAAAGTTMPCSPSFAPPKTWALLEAAVGEKLAWRLGSRIALLPSDASVASESPFEVHLSPTPKGQLLLTARPAPPPHCAPRGPSPIPGKGADALCLGPLSLPAILVGPHNASTAQDVRLSSAFDAAFGHGWKTGRTETRVAAQAAGLQSPDWSVYFVPLSPKSVTGGVPLAKMAPGALAAKWRGVDGILTIWPTHLVRPLAPAPRLPVPPPTRRGPGIGAPPDLLTAASGLFDFFSNYTEPVSDSSEEEENVEAEAEADEEPMAELDADADDTSSKREEGVGSDVDDLFSSHSSPAPETEADMHQNDDGPDMFANSAFTSPQNGALELNVDDLFGTDGDDADVSNHGGSTRAVSIAPSVASRVAMAMAPPGAVISRSSRNSDNGDRVFDITEDDFNFFDSPDKELHDLEVPDLELPAPEATAPAPPPDIPKAEDADAIAVDEVPETKPEESSKLAEAAAEIMDVDVTAPEPEVEVVEVAVPDLPAAPPSDNARPAKKPRLVEMVPDAFAPIPLGKRRRSRFAYGLPSPASPVTNLRGDLVERLSQSQQGSTEKQAEKYDYAFAWHIESDDSDIEDHSTLTTGAPPTPASTSGSDFGTPAPQAPPPAPVARTPDDEVEYDGVMCVGAEWTALKDDTSVAGTLARKWDTSWVDPIAVEFAYPPTPQSPVASTSTKKDPLGSIDIDALANAVVRNRFFRSFVDTAAEAQAPARPVTILLKSGTPLGELADRSDDSDSEKSVEPKAPSYALSPACVNVGFGGNVLRLSIAGLRYWRELGLQPAGGPKDLAAFVICEPGDDEQRTAAGFLRDIGEVYVSNQLGAHTVGEDDTAKEGIVTVTASGVADAVTKLRSRASKPTVIYVLTYNTSVSASSLAPLLASPSHTSFVHVIPADSVRIGNLAPLAFEVYDLVPREISRVLLHGKPLDGPAVWMPAHSFTLASSEEPRPELSMSWPQKSYDVLNRWRLVHGAYAFLPELDVLLLATVDAQGDSCDVRAIRLEPGHTPRDRVARAWEVFTSHAAVAATEWRLTVSSYGLMSPEDLDAWRSFADSKGDPVTLLMVDPPSRPEGPIRVRPPVANIPPTTFTDPSASMVDETLAGGAMTFAHRLAVDLPSKAAAAGKTIFPAASFILGVANIAGTAASSAVYHVLMHRRPAARTDEAPTLLAPEFHRLTCLGRRRYGFEGSLPLHLEAVGAIQRALEAVAAAGTGPAPSKPTPESVAATTPVVSTKEATPTATNATVAAA